MLAITGDSVLDNNIYLFQNDRNIDIYFTIVNFKFDFFTSTQTSENVVEKSNASYATIRVLKPNGTLWISGTMHNIYSIGMALEEEGFKIINNITWQKTNPPPNLACKTFTHSTETILWARKDLPKVKYKFNYNLMKEINDNKQMKDVWTTSLTKPSEKKNGKHPTQKPLEILERIILASTNENDLILDPFCGSSTTGIAATKLNRKYVGIDNSKEYLDLSIRRYQEIKE